MTSLAGKICIVTGATRGIGKGIALQLAQAGAVVYITGRTLKKSSGGVGSLEETAQEIELRGGKCIPVQCDHSNDDDIKNLFDRVSREQNGQLDVLVNNAYSAVTAIIKNMKVPYWEQPESMWDDVNKVGLRNHYICSIYAARMMVPRKKGLIVNISSAGGLRYLFNVPYGIGKEACDRMAADCGLELRKYNVAFVSLWPGFVSTELVQQEMASNQAKLSRTEMSGFSEGSETTEYPGLCIAHLATDPNIMKKTGKVLIAEDLGAEYGFTDINGKSPWNLRSIQVLMKLQNYWWASFIPRWLKLPKWLLALSGSKL